MVLGRLEACLLGRAKKQKIREENLLPKFTWPQVQKWSEETGKLFEDPEFPADDASIFSDSESPPGEFVWKRPHELVADPQFVVDGADRSDVNQGELGDCWFLAAVASLTLNEFNFKRVCPVEQHFDRCRGYAGGFRFNFWHYGRWRKVVVDDRLPTVNGRLVFLHSRQNHEFWPALLEKAYAKLNGSYGALRGGTTSEAQTDFTGGVAECHPLQAKTPDNLWCYMLRAQSRNSLMASSIAAKSRDQVEDVLENGLILGHAYSVTKVAELETSRGMAKLVRLRNPWGTDAEWRGAWCDGATEWDTITQNERGRHDVVFADDGEFWMSFDDFTGNFEKLEICNLTPDSLAEDDDAALKRRWQVTLEQGEWVPRVNAGGCRQFIDTFWTNPQFTVDVQGDEDDASKSTMIVALMQKDARCKRSEGKQLQSIGYIVYRLNAPAREPLPIDFFKYNPSAAKSGAFVNLREVSGRHRLPSGQYLVVPSTFKPNIEGEFILRIATERPNTAAEMDTVMSIDFDVLREKWSSNASTEKKPKDKFEREKKQLCQLFKETAGENGQVDAYELRDILNKVYCKTFTFDGFSKETTRSMVSMYDTSYDGKLQFEEFKLLWGNIQTISEVFSQHDTDGSGNLNSFELRTALKSLDLPVSNSVLMACVMRYASREGNIDFDDFVGMAAKLMAMTERFKAEQCSKRDLSTFLMLTMYA